MQLGITHLHLPLPGTYTYPCILHTSRALGSTLWAFAGSRGQVGASFLPRGGPSDVLGRILGGTLGSIEVALGCFRDVFGLLWKHCGATSMVLGGGAAVFRLMYVTVRPPCENHVKHKAF